MGRGMALPVNHVERFVFLRAWLARDFFSTGGIARHILLQCSMVGRLLSR